MRTTTNHFDVYILLFVLLLSGFLTAGAIYGVVKQNYTLWTTALWGLPAAIACAYSAYALVWYSCKDLFVGGTIFVLFLAFSSIELKPKETPT